MPDESLNSFLAVIVLGFSLPVALVCFGALIFGAVREARAFFLGTRR